MDLDLQRLEETIKRERARLTQFTLEEKRFREEFKYQSGRLQLELDRKLESITRDRQLIEKGLIMTESKVRERVEKMQQQLHKSQQDN